MTTKVNRGGQDYVSPALESFEIKCEGVLCTSGEGGLTVNDWTPGDGVIDF